MLDLIIVTGGSRGIGRSIVEKCASACKNMIVIGSSDAVHEVSVDGDCNIMPLKLNLKEWKTVKSSLSSALSNMHDIKSLGVVLCGAQLGPAGGLLDTNLEDWHDVYECNVIGNLAVVQSCAHVIKSGATTRVVFFGGGGAAFGYQEFSNYSLSKVATIRAAENLGLEFAKAGYDASVIALAPGAVSTRILDSVIAAGGEVRTRTDISEPTNFVFNFLTDKFPSKELNGKFLHVRDDVNISESKPDMFKLRRIQ